LKSDYTFQPTIYSLTIPTPNYSKYASKLPPILSSFLLKNIAGLLHHLNFLQQLLYYRQHLGLKLFRQLLHLILRIQLYWNNSLLRIEKIGLIVKKMLNDCTSNDVNPSYLIIHLTLFINANRS
jgi:hypothetical protein